MLQEAGLSSLFDEENDGESTLSLKISFTHHPLLLHAKLLYNVVLTYYNNNNSAHENS